MRYFRFLVLLAYSIPVLALAAPEEKITRQNITSQDKKRTYYLFVPDSVKAPAPLLITLHGSGRNGITLVEKWKSLASKEGIILAGPDSQQAASWRTPNDGPDFLYDLVEELKAKYPVNPRRVYLFGHSGGAVFALGMSMLESRYFAATAVHAGAWREAGEFVIIDYAKRKIPLALIVGDRDPFFPVSAVEATAQRLKEKGFDVEMTVLKGHDHNYYGKASKINEQLWGYLSKHELNEEPQYDRYQFEKQ